jgi:hypothetical protein
MTTASRIATNVRGAVLGGQRDATSFLVSFFDEEAAFTDIPGEAVFGERDERPTWDEIRTGLSPFLATLDVSDLGAPRGAAGAAGTAAGDAAAAAGARRRLAATSGFGERVADEDEA